MHVKGCVEVSRDKNKIVGKEENALDKDVLRQELKHVGKIASKRTVMHTRR